MKQNSERVARLRKQKRQKLLEGFNSRCGICGYNKTEILQFHHVEPKEKTFTMSSSTNHTWEVFVEEAKKCILVCPNCHMEIHWDLTNIPNGIQRFDETLIKTLTYMDEHKKLLRNCVECGKETYNMKFCSQECSHTTQRKVNWNDIDLIELKKTMTYVAIGRMLGVADNTVKKHYLKRV